MTDWPACSTYKLAVHGNDVITLPEMEWRRRWDGQSRTNPVSRAVETRKRPTRNPTTSRIVRLRSALMFHLAVHRRPRLSDNLRPSLATDGTAVADSDESPYAVWKQRSTSVVVLRWRGSPAMAAAELVLARRRGQQLRQQSVTATRRDSDATSSTTNVGSARQSHCSRRWTTGQRRRHRSLACRCSVIVVVVV